jgi:hypothetical protein
VLAEVGKGKSQKATGFYLNFSPVITAFETFQLSSENYFRLRLRKDSENGFRLQLNFRGCLPIAIKHLKLSL